MPVELSPKLATELLAACGVGGTALSARRLANQIEPTPNWEFQMLYGVGPQLGAVMRAREERLRVSIPYGPQWYPYLMRRIAEARQTHSSYCARWSVASQPACPAPNS